MNQGSDQPLHFFPYLSLSTQYSILISSSGWWFGLRTSETVSCSINGSGLLNTFWVVFGYFVQYCFTPFYSVRSVVRSLKVPHSWRHYRT